MARKKIPLELKAKGISISLSPSVISQVEKYMARYGIYSFSRAIEQLVQGGLYQDQKERTDGQQRSDS